MHLETHRDTREALVKDVSLIHYLIGALLLLLGIILRLVAYDKQGFGWEAVRDIGSFLAATIAVAFVYEKLIQGRERKVFLDDLEELLERKMLGEQRGIEIFASGRPPLNRKISVLNSAEKDIVEFGTSLRTFVSYFQTRPAAEYKDHIVALLQRGVNFHCLMIDPSWAAAHLDSEIAAKATASLHALQQIAAEFASAGWRGKFNVRTYSHVPLFAAIIVDGDSDAGQLFFTPYLYKTNNAEAPAFLIGKSRHPVLFNALWTESVQRQLREAKIVTAQQAHP